MERRRLRSHISWIPSIAIIIWMIWLGGFKNWEWIWPLGFLILALVLHGANHSRGALISIALFGLCLGFIANWASFEIRYPLPLAHGPYYPGLYYPGVIATLIAMGPVAVFNRTGAKWGVPRTIVYLVGIVVIGQILNFWFQKEVTLHLVFMLGPLLLLGYFCVVFSDLLWKRFLTRTC